MDACNAPGNNDKISDLAEEHTVKAALTTHGDGGNERHERKPVATNKISTPF